ncbi:MAG: class I SAM-dependent methyltransferase [Magnetospirillum sp.]|nr:class I SAM-dependent methyltransferase [Magnetospirillum sp.]
MSTRSIVKAYRRYARVYDRLFDTVFAEGRRVAADLCSRDTGGSRILEVGVGTGLSLPAYGSECAVWGIDLSEPMLEKARERVERQGLAHVRELRVMNAEAMEFPDDSFDTVVAMYVASVVADPARMFREISRVCRPGGSVIVVNHFSSTFWLMQALERVIAPLSDLIGFRSNYSMDELLDDARLELVSVQKVNCLGYWTLAHFRNTSVPSAQAQEVPEAAYIGRLGVNPEGA